MDEQTIFNLLECSVCLEPLDVTSRVLPCQHTFCMRCLQQIINTRNELKCPECRELVPCRLVTDLPTNILLVRLLDGLKRPGKAPPGSPPPRTSNAGISGSGETTVSGRSASSKTSIQNQPCAMALYKYDAQEHGDLSFNKSDIILLHKKIDENWYQGVVMGTSDQIGFFPASYVQVLTPLPPDPPQCKALYDFEVNEQEEKDCLTFNKDEVLNVIRRVDENWVEGKKGDKIGIFPLSFVELNGTAKALVDAHAGIDISSGPSHQSQGSGDAGSNPDQTGSGQEGGSKNKAKRHSFTSLLGLSVSAQSKNKDSQPSTNASASTSTSNAASSSNSGGSSSNRHSMEISSPVLVRSSNPTAANLIDNKAATTSQQAAAGTAAAATTSTGATATAADASSSSTTSAARKKPAPLTGISQIPASSTRGPNSPSVAASPTVTQAGNADFRFVAEAPASPKPKVEVYVAMYSYKSTKPDELELKKGDFYTVTEKCKDGWFKGMAVKTGDLGVFPGNYMQAYRHDRSTRKVTTTAPDTRTSQSTSTATSSPSQGFRPRLPSDAASRAASTNQRAMPTEAPGSPSPIQGMRPRVLSDAASRMSAQRASAAAAAATTDASTTSPPVGLSSATTQTTGTRPAANASRPVGQSSQPTSPAPMQQEGRPMAQIPDGQKTVAQLQSERAAQKLQFRPPPPNYPARSSLSTVAQGRATAAHSERNLRGSPPTVGTQTAAMLARTSVSPAGVQQPQSPGVQTRHVGVSSAPISVRPRASSGQAAVGSPPTHNGILQRVRSPSSPQPGLQDGTTTNDMGNAVTKPRGSPILGQGSPKGASVSGCANQPQSTPPQVEVHLSSSTSAKAKRHSAQIPAAAAEAQARQQALKPRRHSESDNDSVRSRRTVQAKATTTQQHPPQSNAQMHPVASCSAQTSKNNLAAATTVSTSQPHPSKQTVVVSSASSQSHSKPSSPSLYRVSDNLPFTPPPNVTAPDCVVASSLAGPTKMDKKDRKDRKASKKRSQVSPDEAAPVPLARLSSLPDGQDPLSTDASPQPRPSPSLPLSATPSAVQGEGSGEETSLGAEGVSDGASAVERRDKPPKTTPLVRERYRVTVPYPPHSDAELELKVGETVFVHSKREDGWFKGTQQRTGKTGLFPGSFVESY
ncbi:E3 ubiquitin-protein ligase SH3RF1-like [Patiria miniata]|uniref:RING-type E3 ubiquitin transferase n=1 Tax=Patiria miniata TaxID=46514 RepID=A0A914A3C3_PATMI|nr:E3 ubiquitin-protein ligase SH3RF1-like [Patiria miniata]